MTSGWLEFFERESKEVYYQLLWDNLTKQYEKNIIYPSYNDVYRIFSLCDVRDVQVVILGQDPYHGEHQANGIAFSVNKGVKYPSSLRNIMLECKSNCGVEINHGDLSSWVKQGVFLMNTIFTVEANKAASHRNLGWEIFSDRVIEFLNQGERKIFVLWGNYSKSKLPLIDKKHHVICSVHPSGLSAHRGFIGSKCFSEINDVLVKWERKPIDFSII